MRTALVTAVAGVVVAFVLGLLTFGVQATVHPRDVPLAVVAPPPVAERVAATGSAEVDIRSVPAEEARTLLADKEVYGVLVIEPRGRRSGSTPRSTPPDTQIAQQVLTGVAQGAGLRLEVETQAVSAAERTAPLAASALLWGGRDDRRVVVRGPECATAPSAPSGGCSAGWRPSGSCCC